MIPMRLDELAAAVGGRLHGADPATVITGTVEYDSRQVTAGGVFIAFVGEHADGHDFAPAAVEQGAVVVVGTRALPGVPMVLVADPLVAMAALARAVVDRLPELTIVGLTGSSGKTTTKDLTAQLLSRLGPSLAAAGSFNNELGHPYTVLGATEQTRFLVLELGARGVGHVKYLCDVAPPRIGVVLNVGVAHIGEFGSVEQIALAKGELVEALPRDGVAVLNADDDRVVAMAGRTVATVVLAGESDAATVRAEQIRLDERGRASYTLITPEGDAPVRLGVTGRHQVANTLAAAAVARALGMPHGDIATALGELRLVSGRRMDVFDRPDGVTVIDDSYNANPASTAAALRTLAAIGDHRPNAPRRTIAVLGYLAELGRHEQAGHADVGRLAAELDVDMLIVVGDNAAPIYDGADAVAGWQGRRIRVSDQEQAIQLLREQLRGGDVVLVKGSRYRTWAVADALRGGAA